MGERRGNGGNERRHAAPARTDRFSGRGSPIRPVLRTRIPESPRSQDDTPRTGADPPRSVIIASEPLTTDISAWLEVPEYSMLTAELTPDGLELETRDLHV